MMCHCGFDLHFPGGYDVAQLLCTSGPFLFSWGNICLDTLPNFKRVFFLIIS